MNKANQYYKVLRRHYPKSDALYEDTIINLIGKDGLAILRGAHKIETCAIFKGRRLYAL